MKKLILTMVMVLCVSLAYAGNNTFVQTKAGTISSGYTTYTPTINGRAQVEAITVKFSATTDENIAVYLNSASGATYDTLLATSDSVSLVDFFWQPDNTLIIERDDDITVQMGAGSGGETYTITIRGEYQ